MGCAWSRTQCVREAVARKDQALLLLPGDINDDALCSQAPQNAQDCVEIGCEQVPLDPAQVTTLDAGGF
jgi:hypothetical protein